MRARLFSAITAILVLVGLTVLPATSTAETLAKKFDASKHKQVDKLVKANSFNTFSLLFLGGPTEGQNNTLWCVVKAHANSKARSKVKVAIAAQIQDAATNAVLGLPKRTGKTNAAGRTEMLWVIPNIDPSALYFVQAEAKFKGKKLDGVWLHCYFGHSDPTPFPLTLGRFDRFGLRTDNATAVRVSATLGSLEFADGSAVLVELGDSSAAFLNAPISSHDPTFQYTLIGDRDSEAATTPIFFRDDMQGINDMMIFTDGFESGDTSVWSTAAP